MARVEIAPRVGDDLGCIFDHLARYDLDSTPARIREIIQAIILGDIWSRGPKARRALAPCNSNVLTL